MKTEANLNRQLRSVAAGKRNEARAQWAQCVAIAKIDSERLWKLHQRDDGGMAYGDRKQFCRAELGISAFHANSLIAIAELFSLALLKRHGLTKLIIASRAPAGDRDRLLAMSLAGASTRAMKNEVAAINWRGRLSGTGMVVPILNTDQEMRAELFRWCTRAAAHSSLSALRGHVLRGLKPAQLRKVS